jgi:hypothetical protein
MNLLWMFVLLAAPAAQDSDAGKYQVKAYTVNRGKKAFVLLVVGKETLDKEYAASVRKAIASLSFK